MNETLKSNRRVVDSGVPALLTAIVLKARQVARRPLLP